MEAFKKEGETAIDAVGDHAEQIAKVIRERFGGDTTWSSVSEKCRKAFDRSGKKNELVSSLLAETHEASSLAMNDLGKVLFWLQLLVPEIEDGNNFGVDVQFSLIKAISEKMKVITEQLEKFPDYFKERTAGMEKVFEKTSTVSRETEGNSKSDVKGGKEEGSNTKTSTSTEKTVTTTSDQLLDDAIEYVIALDTKWVFTFKTVLENSLRSLLVVLDAFEKNKTKVLKPKGSGRSQRDNFY